MDRDPRTVLATVFLLALSCGGPADTPGPPRPIPGGPNVLLITVDTLRKDHLSCYGYRRGTSPHLDALAAQGVRYTRACTQAPWTCPSMAALLTSLYPSRLDVVDMRSAVRESVITLAEVLWSAGYSTWGVTSHTFCSSLQHLDQGFEVFDESNIAGHAAITSPGVTRTAVELIDSKGERPFFLWVHYFDPHFDYREHPGFTFPREGTYRGPITSGMNFDEVRALEGKLSSADHAEMRRLYDSEILFTDHWINELLDHLERRGLASETLVIVTSDHGEAFGERGRIGHGHSLHAELVEAPLIMRFPDGRRGVCEDPVMLVDLYPTILALCGVALDHQVAGRNLLVPSELGAFRRVFMENSRGQVTRAILCGNHKLIRDLQAGTSHLYDLRADPREERDIAAANPDLVRSLEAELAAWLRANTPPAEGALPIEIPPEDRQRLRAMGYLEVGGDR